MLTSEYLEDLIKQGNELVNDPILDRAYFPYHREKVREAVSTLKEIADALEALLNGI